MDLDDPVPINAVFVLTIRTVERCLVGRLTLGEVISGNHSHIYHLNGCKEVVLRLCMQSVTDIV